MNEFERKKKKKRMEKMEGFVMLDGRTSFAFVGLVNCKSLEMASHFFNFFNLSQ